MDPEYARVSTGGQSLDGQLAKLKQHGASVIHREKVSGARSARGRGITGAVDRPWPEGRIIPTCRSRMVCAPWPKLSLCRRKHRRVTAIAAWVTKIHKRGSRSLAFSTCYSLTALAWKNLTKNS